MLLLKFCRLSATQQRGFPLHKTLKLYAAVSQIVVQLFLGMIRFLPGVYALQLGGAAAGRADTLACPGS